VFLKNLDHRQSQKKEIVSVRHTWSSKALQCYTGKLTWWLDVKWKPIKKCVTH